MKGLFALNFLDGWQDAVTSDLPKTCLDGSQNNLRTNVAIDMLSDVNCAKRIFSFAEK